MMYKDFKKIYGEFVWGEIITIHSLFEYTIVEYFDRKRDGNTVTHETDHETISFYDPNNNAIYKSFDEAMIGAIAAKYDGLNSHAGYYFCKMIGLYDE